MKTWGDRLIAIAATLACVAVLGALTVVVADWIDPSRDGPTTYRLALLWTAGITAMYSPLYSWLGLIVLAVSVPWLERQPKAVYALAGVLMALPLLPMAETLPDKVIRVGIGALYGEIFRRILAYRINEKWNH